jgi:hypothetical protein
MQERGRLLLRRFKSLAALDAGRATKNAPRKRSAFRSGADLAARKD